MVENLRAEKAEQMQQQQALENAQAGAQAAKTLSEAKTGGDENLLTDMAVMAEGGTPGAV